MTFRVFDQPFRPNAPLLQKRGDLRDMILARCQNCNYEWWAPTIGGCPRCKRPGAVELERKMTGAPRV